MSKMLLLVLVVLLSGCALEKVQVRFVPGPHAYVAVQIQVQDR